MGSEACTYIRSDHNPADVLTRGTSPEKLKTWSEGPPFLKRPEPEWPKFQENPKESGEELSEEMNRKSKFEAANTHEQVDCSAASTESNDNPILEHLMKSCSTFTKARRTLAYVLRFANNTRLKEEKKDAISPEELRESELWLFKWSQRKINVDAIDKKLIPASDERGVLRAHGRLENITSLPKEMRNPIILPKGHQLVNLLLKHLHEKRAHCGYKSLIYESRKRFWIVGVRSMAKQVTSKCDLQEVAKATAKANDGTDSETARCSRFPSVQQHRNRHVWTSTTANWPEITEGSTSNHIYMHDYKSCPSRARHRQKHRHVSHGFSTFCLTQRISQ